MWGSGRCAKKVLLVVFETFLLKGMIYKGDIDIDKEVLKKIDKAILEHIDIDIDKEILEKINIDKILNRLEFGISNRAIYTPQGYGWNSFVLSLSLVK